MRVFVFVNRVREIGPRQTTALLIAALESLGHEVMLADVDGVSITSLSAATEVQLNIKAVRYNPGREVAEFAAAVTSQLFERLSLTSNDLILIRTNPGRDKASSGKHLLFLEFCQIAKSVGARVVNDPDKLFFFASKTAVALLPRAYRPAMMVTQDVTAAVSFVKLMGSQCVVKPVHGSRGQNVIRVTPDSDDLENELANRFGEQSIVVQEFVKCAEPGDKRVVVLNGKLIEHGGSLAGIHRLPATGDFRANLHAGGQAMPLQLTLDQRKAAEVAASLLVKQGIQLAGIDLIGSKVIEFNVFSTGGLYDANRFAKFDFAKLIARRLLVT